MNGLKALISIILLLYAEISPAQTAQSGKTTVLGTTSIYTINTGPPPSVANFYVSTTGSDSNPGTFAKPFLTPNKAITAVAGLGCSTPQSYLVYFFGGNYWNTYVPPSVATGGNANCPVTYENYPGQTAYISGGSNIGGGGWTSSSSYGICGQITDGSTCYYKQLSASIPYPERFWYCVGGTMTNCNQRWRPQLGATTGTCTQGNASFNCLVGRYGHSTGSLSGNSGFTFSTASTVNGIPNVSPATYSSCNLSTPNDCEVLGFNKWAINFERVSSITGSSVYTTCGSNCPSSGGPGNPYQNGQRYVLTNVKELFKYGQQIFIDRSSTNPNSPNWTIYYSAVSGENPNNDVVIIGNNANVINASNWSYVTLQGTCVTYTNGVCGLVFQNDNWQVPKTGYTGDQLDHSLSGTSAAIVCNPCNNVTFSAVVREATSVGIAWLGASAHNTMTGFVVEDTGSYCVRWGVSTSQTGSEDDTHVPNNNVMTNGYLDRCGTAMLPTGDGFMAGVANNLTVTYVRITHTGHGGWEICEPTKNSAGDPNTCDDNNSSTNGDFNIVLEHNDIYFIFMGLTSDGACGYHMTAINPSKGVATGNYNEYNRCHDVNSDTANGDSLDSLGNGFYFDGNTGGWTVKYNLVYRTTGWGITQNFGPLNNSPDVACTGCGQANFFQNNIIWNQSAVTGGVGGIRMQNACNGGSTSGCSASCSVKEYYSENNIMGGSNSVKTANGQCGPTDNSTSTNYMVFSSNVYCMDFTGSSCPTAPTFNAKGSSNLSFASWQGIGEDAGSTHTTLPGFTAPFPNPNNSGLPTPGSYDDFSCTSPGFGISCTPFNNTYGPTFNANLPDVGATFPEAMYAPVNF